MAPYPGAIPRIFFIEENRYEKNIIFAAASFGNGRAGDKPSPYAGPRVAIQIGFAADVFKKRTWSFCR
jgi:hypothetical protein